MSKIILVTGSNGQVGSEIREIACNYAYKFIFTDRNDLDISDEAKNKIFFQKNRVDYIINCAAYTAVDRAESDIEKADLVNHKAVKELAYIAKEKNITLIHISTDYVFDGKNYKPYAEDDKTNPKSIYGQTKLDGERAILDLNLKKSVIIRTSWVYSSFGNNFVKTMLRLGKEKEELGVIFDQIGTPTYAKDLAKVILDNLEGFNGDKTEIYHFTNEGVCSWYDFAKSVFELSKLECKLKPIETKDYPTSAKRPHYTLLNKGKIKNDFNLQIPYWRESLIECLKELGEIK